MAQTSGSALEELEGAEEEDGSSSEEDEDSSDSDEEEDSGSEEEEDSTTSEEDDDANICRKLITCTGVLPHPVSGKNAYKVSKYPSAETVMVQFPAIALSSNEPELPFPNPTSILSPPPLWAKRTVKALPFLPLTESK